MLLITCRSTFWACCFLCGCFRTVKTSVSHSPFTLCIFWCFFMSSVVFFLSHYPFWTILLVMFLIIHSFFISLHPGKYDLSFMLFMFLISYILVLLRWGRSCIWKGNILQTNASRFSSYFLIKSCLIITYSRQTINSWSLDNLESAF